MGADSRHERATRGLREPERGGGGDAFLQAAIQSLLDPGALGKEGRWLRYDQQLIVRGIESVQGGRDV